MDYAGFWRRFGAYWLDVILLLPLSGITYFLSEKFRLFSVYSFIPMVLFSLWYHVYLVKRYGGTPGKLLVKTRITMLDGSPVTLKAAAIRFSILFLLSHLTAIATLIGTLAMSDELYHSLSFMKRAVKLQELTPSWNKVVIILMQIWIWSEFIVILCNKKRRAVHDFMAGTVVIRSTPRILIPPVP